MDFHNLRYRGQTMNDPDQRRPPRMSYYNSLPPEPVYFVERGQFPSYPPLYQVAPNTNEERRLNLELRRANLNLRIAEKNKKGIKISLSDRWEQIKINIKRRFVTEPFAVPLFLTCFVLLTMQMTECIEKLRHPRVMVNSKSEASEFPIVPAFSFCSLKPYDLDKLKNVGVIPIKGKEYLSQKYPKYWDWSGALGTKIENLTKFWESIISESTIVPTDNIAKDMDARWHYNVNRGRCVTYRYTKSERFEQFNDMAVFAFIMRAPAKEREKRRKMLEGTNEEMIKFKDVLRDDGWILYVHDTQDEWSGLSAKARLKENLQIHFEEHQLINIQMTSYTVISNSKMPCNKNKTYSIMQCESECISAAIASQHKCNVPWMKQYPNLSECSDPKQLDEVVDFDVYSVKCECERRCSFVEYQTTISSRVYDAQFNSSAPIIATIAFRFAIGKVNYVTQYWDYDINQFISDSGGSIGLFLGMSIMSLAYIPNFLFKMVTKLLRRCRSEVSKRYDRMSGNVKH